MNEPKTTSLTCAELAPERAAGQSRTVPARVQAVTPYIWDRIDKDDRPLNHEEMHAGIEAVQSLGT
jgi:hypothetical protein